eukprot:762639-Hanusia_phi.AAC.4
MRSPHAPCHGILTRVADRKLGDDPDVWVFVRTARRDAAKRKKFASRAEVGEIGAKPGEQLAVEVVRAGWVSTGSMEDERAR